MIVAIDGPAGSGKGTVTKKIANKMKLLNLDSGAVYRCVALQSLRNGLKLEQEKEIIELIDGLDIEFKHNDGNINVYLNKEDVTSEIRSKEVTNIVSFVSSIVDVRIKVTELLRKMAMGKDVIMEGRDICTYVFPNADVKIYLDADVESRAQRRFKENQEKNINTSYEEVLENVKTRDYNDMNKQIGSLKVAEGATVIDSTNMSIEEVVQEVERIILTKTI